MGQSCEFQVAAGRPPFADPPLGIDAGTPSKRSGIDSSTSGARLGRPPGARPQSGHRQRPQTAGGAPQGSRSERALVRAQIIASVSRRTREEQAARRHQGFGDSSRLADAPGRPSGGGPHRQQGQQRPSSAEPRSYTKMKRQLPTRGYQSARHAPTAATLQMASGPSF
jgi:hypothetical protein